MPKDDALGTLLHLGAMEGHKEIAKLLITAGADVNAKIEVAFYKGQTPLDLAKPYEDDSPEDKAARMEITALLRKHGGKTSKELKTEGK